MEGSNGEKRGRSTSIILSTIKVKKNDTNINGKNYPSSHTSMYTLVPAHKRTVTLGTDHFIKTGPLMCCQRAIKDFLLVYGDCKIMLGWMIEIQILAKIL